MDSCIFHIRNQSEIQDFNHAQFTDPRSSKFNRNYKLISTHACCVPSPATPLTKKALKELNRTLRKYRKKRKTRNRTELESCMTITEENQTTISQVAREGGLDLSDLRGYSDTHREKMDKKQSDNRSRGGMSVEKGLSQRSISKTTTSKITKTTGTINPRNSLYRDTLNDNGVFHYGYYNIFTNERTPKPKNLDQIMARIKKTRPESDFPAGDFEKFEIANFDAENEATTMIKVIPLLEGKIEDGSKGFDELIFSNMEPLIKGLSTVNPDRVWGASRLTLNGKVLKELTHLIRPAFGKDIIAPNFFLEVKGPDGSPAVAEYQALYGGATGERGQLALRSWRVDNPTLGKVAHTFAVTYIYGHLSLFSVHAEPSQRGAGEIDYHMHKLNSYAVTGDVDQYRVGVTAYRNLLEYAKEIRDESNKIANRRAEEVAKDKGKSQKCEFYCKKRKLDLSDKGDE